MKTRFVKAGIFAFRLLYFLLLRWFFPKKVLNFKTGWDTLHPFAPFSYGGIPRKKFLVLYRRMNRGLKISSDDYHRAQNGSSNPTLEQFTQSYERRERMKELFSFKT